MKASTLVPRDSGAGAAPTPCDGVTTRVPALSGAETESDSPTAPSIPDVGARTATPKPLAAAVSVERSNDTATSSAPPAAAGTGSAVGVAPAASTIRFPCTNVALCIAS